MQMDRELGRAFKRGAGARGGDREGPVESQLKTASSICDRLPVASDRVRCRRSG